MISASCSGCCSPTAGHRADAALERLDEAIAALRGQEGRKVVLVFSDGGDSPMNLGSATAASWTSCAAPSRTT